MPTDHILSLLMSERDKLTRAIEVLQGNPRTTTQPKKAMPATDAALATNHTRKRRWTAAQKKAADAHLGAHRERGADDDLDLIIKALDHYHAYTVTRNGEDARYRDLAERLKRKPTDREPTSQPAKNTKRRA